MHRSQRKSEPGGKSAHCPAPHSSHLMDIIHGGAPWLQIEMSEPTNRTKVSFSTAARPPSHRVHQSVQHPLVEFCMRCGLMSAGLVAGQDQEKPPVPDLLHDPRHGLRRISLV